MKPDLIPLLVPPVLGLLVSLLAAGAPPVSSAPAPAPDPKGIEFFETKIRPVLVEQCGACHGAKLQQGGLRLDTVAGIRKGGTSGPLFHKEQPAQSFLLKAMRHEPGVVKMPPQGKLPAAVLANFEKWVAMGAPTPAPAAGATPPDPQDLTLGRKHWAFQPLRELPAPKVANPAWVRKKLDGFILAGLAKQGMTPSPEADRRTLIRRVYFDLIGLAPTYEEVQAFEADSSPDAYEKLVDRLLAMPQYGERWGRHWLDVARYAEDNPTSEATNQPPAYAWRYRDWVVSALNRDLPYDQFLTRQLAADLMPDVPVEERAALGFLGLSPVYHKELMLARDVVETIAADEWDERLDTVSRGFLGLTVACARCHDHKFDPISAKDYYALAGVIASTQLVERPLVEMPDEQAEQLARAERRLRELERDLRRKKRDLERAEGDGAKKLADEIAKEEAELEKLKATPGIGAPMANVVRDAALWVNGDDPARTKLDYRPGASRNLPVFIRGSVSRPGETVPRRFLTVLSPGAPKSFGPGSGRLDLAEAMLTDAAPLTARVIVNRVWGWHFGRPLVDTPSNFGRLGGKPSHPELLTDLSARFVRAGWSLKWLHREIVLSAAYRQSGANRPAYSAKDAENKWLWRMVPRRLEVEAWRDTILQVAGELDLTVGGPSDNLESRDNRRRTLYGRVSRQRPADVLRLFDFPDANRHGEQRTPTTTPLQQLYFLNSPFIQRCADRLAEQATAAGGGTDEPVRRLFRQVLQRDPRPDEAAEALRLVQSCDPANPKEGWSALAQALLCGNELLFVD
ncbi:MAG: DUF1549 domain-containing protein [Armatimonadota bacterium]